MHIGIEASRANRPVKTGVEWYAWHVIQQLKALPGAAKHQWSLYSNSPLQGGLQSGPANWKERRLSWPPRYLWTQARLSWEMRRRPSDVLFVPAHVLPVISPKKSVVTVHDVGFKRFPEAYKKIQVAYHEITTRDIVRRNARIITVSEFCKREIVELYGAKPEHIFVTPLGLDHDRYRPQTVRPEKPYLLFVGRVDKKKNLITLVRAFELVADEFPHLELKIAGTFSGPAGLSTTGAKELMEAIQFSPYQDRIDMLGYVKEEEKPALLSGASIYIQPSIYEGFGLPPLEAMACGTPTICADSTCLPEVVGEGNALFFDPKDTEALASAMRRILSEPTLREDLIQRGLARAKQFAWNRTAEETLRILETW
ncbi:glycosyltransferase family 4 protein [Patescibacteria group bacterium]|jgi:glycosyltransferase involved in cell wall biosynthesis|nr:glycosyltransferase family 4 protein [Patescibacteria group bacterium]